MFLKKIKKVSALARIEQFANHANLKHAFYTKSSTENSSLSRTEAEGPSKVNFRCIFG